MKTRKNRKGKREVICTDAIQWLENHSGLDSIVTSIPEMDELGLKYKDYIPFLRNAAHLCLESTKDSGYVIFLQTDRKYKGWVDKSYFISDEAYKLGYRMVWHKIALRKEPGKSDLFRPTYSHMLCYTKAGKAGPLLPDVIQRGSITYDNAFGVEAVKLAIQFLKQCRIKKVYDVFVGSGTTLAVANAFGLDAVGIDIDKAQCKKAQVASI
jgi:DNA methylase